MAWVTSLRSKEAGRWISAPPKTPKNRFTPREFQTIIRFRLLMPQLRGGISCTCKSIGKNSFNRVDETGHHFVSGCCKTGMRNELHNMMERELAYNFRYCGLSVITEELDCFKIADPNCNKRPDLSIDNAQELDSGEDRTRRLILDFSLTGPLPGNQSGILIDPPLLSADVEDRAANKAFDKKNSMYYDRADQNNLSFLPFIMETTGRMHPRAIKLLRSCAKLAEDSHKISKAILYGFMIKNISCVLQKRIAQLIIRRITGIHGRQSDAARNSYYSSHEFVSTSHHFRGERHRF